MRQKLWGKTWGWRVPTLGCSFSEQQSISWHFHHDKVSPCRLLNSQFHQRNSLPSRVSDRAQSDQIRPGWVGSCAVGTFTPTLSDVSQQRKGQEVAECWAHDDSQEDPGVVGHDAQHQHVAQRHLHQVEQRLHAVQQDPAGQGREERTPGDHQWTAVSQG